ncbi:MAG: TAXI family TRAP transporter solute-binding subunit [Clostridiales bacterium]|nr:TAXI family TRAP transporter solute-binding subunit [Clostridiales bacterium]
MKRKLGLLIASVLLLTLALGLLTACGDSGQSDDSDDAGDSDGSVATSASIKLATGGTSGTYYAFGGVVAQTLMGKVPGLDISVQSTGASRANIIMVHDNEVEMAIVQNDVMDYAYNGTDLFENEKTDGFRSMAGAYAEVCQIVVNPSAGISSVADLAGKRVSVGDVGSGVEFNARQILAAYDLTFDDIQRQNLSFADSATAMQDGKIDAFFCTAGAPTTAITELATTSKIAILNVDGAAAARLIAEHPFYTPYTITVDKGYKGMEQDAVTVAVKATFIVSPSLSEELVYNMTKALFENKDEIAVGHNKGTELDPAYAVEGVSVPFHPGAEKYFKEIGVLS